MTFEHPEPIAEPVLEQQPRAEALFGQFETVTAVPTVVPKNLLNQFKYYAATSTLYYFDVKNNAWVAAAAPATPYDPFAQFIDLINWNSIDGYTHGGTGGAASSKGSMVNVSTSSGSATTSFLYSTEKWNLIHQTGKLLTIEWELMDYESATGGGGKVWLNFQDGSATPPTTQAHFGFQTTSDQFYLSTGDGTTQKTTALGTSLVAGIQRLKLKLVVDPGVTVKAYINDVLLATHTSSDNIPDPATYTNFRLELGVETGNTTLREIYVGRTLIQKVY